MIIKGRYFTSRKYPDPEDEGLFFDLPLESIILDQNDDKKMSTPPNLSRHKKKTESTKESQKKTISHKKTLNIQKNDNFTINDNTTSKKMEKILDEAFEEIEKYDYFNMKKKKNNFDELGNTQTKKKQINNNDSIRIPKLNHKNDVKCDEVFLNANNESSDDIILFKKDDGKNINHTIQSKVSIDKTSSSTSSYSSDNSYSDKFFQNLITNSNKKPTNQPNTDLYHYSTPQFAKNQNNNEIFHSDQTKKYISHQDLSFNTPKKQSPVQPPPSRLSGSMSPIGPLTPLDIRFQRDFEAFVRNSNSNSSSSSKSKSKSENQKTPNFKSQSVRNKNERNYIYNTVKPYKVDLIKKQNELYKNKYNDNESDSMVKYDYLNKGRKIVYNANDISETDNYEYSYEIANNSFISGKYSNKINNNYDNDDSDINYVNRNYVKNFDYNNDDYMSYSSSFIQKDVKRDKKNKNHLVMKNDKDDYESYSSSATPQLDRKSVV